MKKLVTAVVGAQWGDEGKGKITDYFAQNSQVIVRWSGGDNAGHTIVFSDKKYQLSIIPSGIFNQKVLTIIANGCVINLEKLIAEINYLKTNGFHCQNLRISDRAHIIFPYHLEIDKCEEQIKGKKAIGTTKRGIGPCLSDKINRIGIRIGDLLQPEIFYEKLRTNVNAKNNLLKKIYNSDKCFNSQQIYQQIINEFLPILKPLITDTTQLLNTQLAENKTILFEGAQGTLLDIDHGTYPFVTSSHPLASSIAIGSGIALNKVSNVIGVSKAYNTRVGAGVFPTEFNDEVAERIRKIGKEYGTVSKRPRRIGWFDAVITKYSAQLNGFTGLAITLLDVLSGLKELQICTHYLLEDKVINYVPSQLNLFEKCIPQYITLPGWLEDITSVTSFQELPINAQNYLNKVSELVGVPIYLFSIGPDRKQTVILEQNND